MELKIQTNNNNLLIMSDKKPTIPPKQPKIEPLRERRKWNVPTPSRVPKAPSVPKPKQ